MLQTSALQPIYSLLPTPRQQLTILDTEPWHVLLQPTPYTLMVFGRPHFFKKLEYYKLKDSEKKIKVLKKVLRAGPLFRKNGILWIEILLKWTMSTEIILFGTIKYRQFYQFRPIWYGQAFDICTHNGSWRSITIRPPDPSKNG